MFLLRSGVLLLILLMGSATLILLADEDECKEEDYEECQPTATATNTTIPSETPTQTPQDPPPPPTVEVPTPTDTLPSAPSPTASETPTPTPGLRFIITGFGETPTESTMPSVTPTSPGAGGLETPTITATPTITKTPPETVEPGGVPGTPIPEPTILIDSEKPEGGPEMGWPEATTASVSVLAAAALLWPLAVALAKRADPCACKEEEKE